LLYVCHSLPEQGPDALGPRFFPLMLTSAMSALSMIVVMQSIDFSGTIRKKNVEKSEKKDPVAVKMQWIFIGLLAAYIGLMPVVGYSAATFGFCFLAMSLLGPRGKKSVCVNALMAAITSAALTYIFGHLLMLFLP
jgi:hypothetical protein